MNPLFLPYASPTIALRQPPGAAPTLRVLLALLLLLARPSTVGSQTAEQRHLSSTFALRKKPLPIFHRCELGVFGLVWASAIDIQLKLL